MTYEAEKLLAEMEEVAESLPQEKQPEFWEAVLALIDAEKKRRAMTRQHRVSMRGGPRKWPLRFKG